MINQNSILPWDGNVPIADYILQLTHPLEQEESPIVFRLNPRFGVRCPSCGRLFRRVHCLPVRRTCRGCKASFRVLRTKDGVHFEQVDIPEAVSSSPTSFEPSRGPLSKTSLQKVYKELNLLAQDLMKKEHPSEKELYATLSYHNWLRFFSSYLGQFNVEVRDYPIERDPSLSQMQSQFFSGQGSQYEVRLLIHSDTTVGEFLEEYKRRFRTYLKEYIYVIRHEFTHLIQLQRARRNQRGKTYLSYGKARRQSYPDDMGYLSSPSEVEAVANEFSELVMRGHDLTKNSRFRLFFDAYGRDNPATKLLLKKMFQILQPEDPKHWTRFLGQLKRL